MASDFQQRSQLAGRLMVAIATPVILLVLLGGILGRQILEMTDDAKWLDHSDQVLSVATETVKQIIDQETGIRGYLVTEDPTFLEPYEHAHPREGFDHLQALVADNPPQQLRFQEARNRYEDWDGRIAPILRGHDLVEARTNALMRERKARMDGIREAIASAMAVEQGLRRDRVEASRASTRMTKILFVLLLSGSAAVLAFFSRRQLSSIASTFAEALEAEAKARAVTEAESWIRAGLAKVVLATQGERTIEQIANESLAVLAESTGATVGAFFTQEAGKWQRRAGFALDSRKAGAESFLPGEGIVGRVADEGKMAHLRDVPPDFFEVRSGTGQSPPAELVVLPARVEEVTNAVVELGFLRPPDARALALLDRVGEGVAIAVRSSEYKDRLRHLLEEAQRQSEELQTQQEELRVANEELETQTVALRKTQEQLEVQHAELEQTNENLGQQTHLLERQNRQLGEKQAEIATKAREVERASQFKSEFLSNMSHELRTPLNSSLILSKLLADNRDGNLTPDQVRSAETIYSAGNDLLALINDILDLSKIEAGKMSVTSEQVPIERIRANLLRTFEPIAKDKALQLGVTVAASAPLALETDPQRLDQILRNLVSNALKFTEQGEVAVEVSKVDDRVAFSVRDTGIGIPGGQQQIIFEAFRQADGTTNRKYGGTGLGLSISRELARLLGGDIKVTSEAGKGSTFTVSLPLAFTAPVTPPLEARPPPALAPARPPSVPDLPLPDSEDPPQELQPGQRLVLVVEDDPRFADILSEVAREAGFQCFVAATGRRGFHWAKKYLPMGIILDVQLPDHTGLSVLDRLKQDPATRHIPVHVISATDSVEKALAMGAAAYTVKPVKREQLTEAMRALERRSSHRLRRVLVVEDDDVLRENVAKLLGRDGVDIKTAASVSEALNILRAETIDCVVTDLLLPGQSGFELLETMASEEPYSVPPVIVYTGRALTGEEEMRLRKYSSSIIIKGAHSPERLLDEVTLFLHQVESELPVHQQRLLKAARHRESIFEGRTILVVEDDVRNVFALTSILEPKGAHVTIARNGKEALLALAKNPATDLVLMDVMMPEMDGLEATREIRKNPQWNKLPVIMLTAKAMRDDQERCMAAGANDYLAKPLDVEMLLSLLRVWMPKE
jgi:CheY-like chemotaxis protein/signal transduction histidine kinase/CHASE3 domain sensor protein